MSSITKKQMKKALDLVKAQILQVIQEADADIGAVRAALSTHTGKRDNPHGVTATQVGARPSNWTPTAADVGAAPANHTHTAAQVGAAASNHSHSNYVPTTRKVNNKPLSADISLTAADVGAAAASHGTHVSYSTTAPVMDGTASVGTAGTVARSDHRHPTDTSRAAASHTHTASDVGAAAASHTHTPSSIGAAAASHGTHVSYSTTAPVMDGTASVGSASTVARSDHKHPTDTSRAAANHTHTKSQIMDFPSSMPASDVYAWAKNASKPTYTASEVGALASGGTAAAATKLATSRTIRTNLSSTSTASFNGTADVTPGVTGTLGTANGGTGNNTGLATSGQKTGTTLGTRATAEGYNTTASGSHSHAEGWISSSSGDYSHAEGNYTIASGKNSHAEGYNATASGESSHAEGYGATASGKNSHAEGNYTVARGESSHAEGHCTIASARFQHVSGIYNVEKTSETDRFIIGKGTVSARANCFRVSDNGTYAKGSYNASGADYAELFEWADGNPGNEDRAGLFVTLDGDKLRLAGPEDDYILGIVSGNPSIVGDVHDDQWVGMYLYDIFGRPIWEDVEVPDETVEEPDPENPEQTVTRVIIPAHTEHRQKLNPDYDGTQPYTARSQRPEWDAVGLMGKLVAVDDGTCQVNGYCTVGEGGAATASEARTKYRVMRRLDETHVQVMILP